MIGVARGGGGSSSQRRYGRWVRMWHHGFFVDSSYLFFQMCKNASVRHENYALNFYWIDPSSENKTGVGSIPAADFM